MGEKAVEMAARILTGNPANDGLLNADLYNTLERLDLMIDRLAASRETVAAIILAWEMVHPGKRTFGE